NPLATAAGLATLRLADASVYGHVDRVAGILADAVGQALGAAGGPHVVNRAGNLFSGVVGERAATAGVRDYAGATAPQSWRSPAFFHAMLDAGVALPPSVYEAWFLTAAHDAETVDVVLDALPRAARAAAAARPPAGGTGG